MSAARELSPHDQAAVDWCTRTGGSRRYFESSLKRLLYFWHRTRQTDAIEALREFKGWEKFEEPPYRIGMIPDAWRVEEQGSDGWGIYRFVMFEVAHSSPITPSKLERIVYLFWVLDSAGVELTVEVQFENGSIARLDMAHHAYSHAGFPLRFLKSGEPQWPPFEPGAVKIQTPFRSIVAEVTQ